jgi:hypothetical protein
VSRSADDGEDGEDGDDGHHDCEHDNQVGDSGHFSFIVRHPSTSLRITGGMVYLDASGSNVKSLAISSLVIFGNTATFAGLCTNNGVPCTFVATVTDNGESGTSDTFTISVSGGPARGGTIRSGNIRIQR